MLHTFAVLVTSTWYHGTWHGQITWHRQLKDATRWTLPHHCFVQMNVRNNHSSCETKGAFSKPYPCSDVNSDIPSLSRDSNIQLKKTNTKVHLVSTTNWVTFAPFLMARFSMWERSKWPGSSGVSSDRFLLEMRAILSTDNVTPHISHE